MLINDLHSPKGEQRQHCDTVRIHVKIIRKRCEEFHSKTLCIQIQHKIKSLPEVYLWVSEKSTGSSLQKWAHVVNWVLVITNYILKVISFGFIFYFCCSAFLGVICFVLFLLSHFGTKLFMFSSSLNNYPKYGTHNATQLADLLQWLFLMYHP